MKTTRNALIGLGLLGLAGTATLADEGMWLLTNPPREQLRDRYGFEPTNQWLEHMQLSAVRFGGASGSLVSPNGLVMTNHHVGRSAISKLSSSERDLVANGFYASTLADELPCADTEVRVLRSTEDVTDRVNRAVTDDMSPADAGTARRQAMSRIEQEAEEATGLNCQVVTLYNGGQYHLYRYSRYTDLRLVFAPEQQAASFGGDIDNFEYPRFCADFSFFRIYVDGKPLHNEHYLTWSEAGAKEDDLALIFGHPGRTNRLDTVADLMFTRDVTGPSALSSRKNREVELTAFMGRSTEHRRIGQTVIKGVANGRKAWTGYMGGLLDPVLMENKRASERRLRDSYMNGSAETNPWDALERAFATYGTFYHQRSALSGVFFSALSGRALTLVRMSEELAKPSEDRLREYRDTALPSAERQLFSPRPIYDILEIDNLASSLAQLAAAYGGDHPIVREALAGQSPRRRAESLVMGTKLQDVAERKRLAEGGAAAIASSNDPMIVLARSLDAESRRLRQRYEDEVQAVETEAYAQIAAAKFALDGDGVYPDATSSLRFTFGPVTGWEKAGQQVEPFTNIGGMFKRAELRSGEPDFVLPDSWTSAESRIDKNTPMNFVCMGDVIGGNSGSPVVNTKGEVIGLVFDGNLHMLVGRFAYDGRTNRCVCVDARLIIESLSKVYGADRIVQELLGK